MSSFYHEPVTKPPLANDSDNPNGKPSDHLIVVWCPLFTHVQESPRYYRDVEYRPIPDSGLARFGEWLKLQTWSLIYKEKDVDIKAQAFHTMLMNNFEI